MKVTTTYLQMFARPERVVPPPREGLSVVHAKEPTVAYYRLLYDAVGRDYDWTSRKMLPDVELDALLHDPRVEVHVLMADGVTVYHEVGPGRVLAGLMKRVQRKTDFRNTTF